MKRHLKISLIIIGIACFTGLFGNIRMDGKAFVLAFGLICCAGGILSLLAAAILKIFKLDHSLARDFLLAACITLLVGAGVGSTSLLFKRHTATSVTQGPGRGN